MKCGGGGGVVVGSTAATAAVAASSLLGFFLLVLPLDGRAATTAAAFSPVVVAPPRRRPSPAAQDFRSLAFPRSPSPSSSPLLRPPKSSPRDDNEKVGGGATTEEKDPTVESWKARAAKAKLEAERLRLELDLEKLDALEKLLKSDVNGNAKAEEREEAKEKVMDLARRIRPDLVSGDDSAALPDSSGGAAVASAATATKLPPLTEAELESATTCLQSLPSPLREALAQTAGYPSYTDASKNLPEFLGKLRDVEGSWTADALRRVYNSILSPQFTSEEEEEIYETENPFDKLLKENEINRRDTVVEQFLPRVTRIEGRTTPSMSDAQFFAKKICDRSTFVPTANPEKVPGGYVVRGNNRLGTAKELVDALDTRVKEVAPDAWEEKFRFCYVRDPTPDAVDNDVENFENVGGDPVLFLTGADTTPDVSPFFLSAVTASGLFTTFLFGVGSFGANEEITKRLQNMNALGDYGSLDWFNDRLLEVIGPLILIQAFHEFGHLAVAWRHNVKISPPTVIPFLALPFLGCKTSVKTSPPNYSSLFDLAFAGPLLGLIASTIFLGLGLTLTTSAEPTTASELFPCLPVSFLKSSTLVGTIVDEHFGGGGAILGQDPTTAVPLHPFAVAGFVSLIINALDLIPAGSTDGGRLSQSIFGRIGHSVFSGWTWAALIASTIFLDKGAELFLGYLIINSFAQKDLEVPCRDEIENVNAPRAALAFGAWFLAVLILVPLS